MSKVKIKPSLKKKNSEWEIIPDDIPMAQDGKKISLDEFRPKFANSNEKIQQDLIKQNIKGSLANPINLPEVEISTVRDKPLGFAAQSLKSQQTNPANIPASEVASQIFSFIPEAFHTPSRVVNYVLGADNPYKSEISETLGWQSNDPTDLWASSRNFFIDNAADILVPTEGLGNISSKTLPRIGSAAKTSLRESVDLVHPVGKKLRQIEQEGVKQGLSKEAIKNRQMQEIGITSLQREGYFPGVSEVLSEYLVPYSYDNARKRLLDIPKKIIKGDTNTKRLADLNKVILDQGENTLSKPRYDAWRMYSGLPQKHGTFRMAETSPINHPSYTQNELSNLEKFSLNDERRLLTTLPNEYDYPRFMYNDEDLLNNVNYLKDQLKDINNLQKKGIDFPQSDFTTTNVMGGHNRRFFDNKMEYNDVWDLDLSGLKVDRYFGKPFMSHGQLEYSFEPAKKSINNLLRKAELLDNNINIFKGKSKYNFDDIKLNNYNNLLDTKVQKKKIGGKIKTDPNGYWDKSNHGKPVRIPSNKITMKGVNQPLYGIDDTGFAQMMYPNQDYQFPGSSVVEIPLMQQGGNARPPIKGTKEQYQAYQDSTSLFNMGEWSYNQFKNITKRNKTTSQEAKDYSNFYQMLREKKGFVEPNERLFRLNGEMPKGTFFSSNGIKDENCNIQYFSGERFKKPVQPIIYEPEKPIQQFRKESGYHIEKDENGFDKIIWDTPKQRPKQQPIKIESVKPDLLPLPDINMFNPIPFEKGAYFSRKRQSQEQSAKGKKDYFDKKTGKLLGTYKNGGKVKNSDWEIIFD